MNIKYITSILILLITIISVNATDSGIFHPGFNLWNWDINLMGKTIHNGTVNGTNFADCLSIQSSSWNGSWLNCIDDDDSMYATNTNLSNHTTNYSNPHNYTETDTIALSNISTNWNLFTTVYNATYHNYASAISGLQGNDTAINASISGKVNKTGDNITGKICIATDNRVCQSDNSNTFKTNLLLNTTTQGNPASPEHFAAGIGLYGNVYAPAGFAYGMHLSQKIAPIPNSVYAGGWGVGFYSNAICDTGVYGAFQHCAGGYLARLTKNGSSKAVNSYGLFIQSIDSTNAPATNNYGLYIGKYATGSFNYSIYSESNVGDISVGDNVTIRPLAGSGNALTILDSTGKLTRSAMATSDPDGNNSNNYFVCFDGGTGTTFILTTATCKT
ncbi:MAG: hypothetical protein KJ888_20295 [Gammaproteobacteria bacterium]|uniref:Uncharacterized protein n=1 Tax=viral metagenome TaxID=1070528 RepID=A0A6M3L8V7_9ZZZZ|nr:hypothetical protein [Gammaproteobacteria bacterium]